MSQAQGGTIPPYIPAPGAIPVMLTPPEEPYVLTDAGWPRPRVNGLPVPWVAPTRNLGEVNDGRRDSGLSGSICQVCGMGYDYGSTAVMLTSVPANWVGPLRPGDPMPDHADHDFRYAAFDSAVLHHRCMKLARAMCPHLRDAIDMVLVEVPANDADPLREQERGRLVPTYSADACIIVETTWGPS